MPRTGQRTRRTRETEISARIDLDGSGRSDVQTGVGFFDHMLDAFARHGGFDLELRCEGDLQVDRHHTVEDVGIALGGAFLDALGEKRGLSRF
nr:imidazoleglycerol-phosphate dehydratase [Gemmatimonadota bacterium]